MPFARSSRAASPVPEVPPSPAAPGHTQAPSLSIAPLKGQVTPCSSRRYSVLTHGSPCTPFGVDLRPKGVKRVAYWMTVMDEPGKTRNWDDDFQVITYDDKNDVTVRAPRRPHFGSVSSLWAAAIPGTVFQEPKPASVSPPVGSITRSLAQSGVSSTRTQRRRRARAVLDDRPRPFRCVECSARFGMRGHLSQHERYVHSGHRPHKCTWAGCDVSFGTIFAKKQVRLDESYCSLRHYATSCDHCN